MDQNQQHFSYQGWTFRREHDGSLIIEPQGSNTGSEVFKDQPKQNQQMVQSITIPQEEVYRLLGYCLTGDLNNTQVVKTLKDQYSLVGAGSGTIGTGQQGISTK